MVATIGPNHSRYSPPASNLYSSWLLLLDAKAMPEQTSAHQTGNCSSAVLDGENGGENAMD
jgi:hypothetical protein